MPQEKLPSGVREVGLSSHATMHRYVLVGLLMIISFGIGRHSQRESSSGVTTSVGAEKSRDNVAADAQHRGESDWEKTAVSNVQSTLVPSRSPIRTFRLSQQRHSDVSKPIQHLAPSSGPDAANVPVVVEDSIAPPASETSRNRSTSEILLDRRLQQQEKSGMQKYFRAAFRFKGSKSTISSQPNSPSAVSSDLYTMTRAPLVTNAAPARALLVVPTPVTEFPNWVGATEVFCDTMMHAREHALFDGDVLNKGSFTVHSKPSKVATFLGPLPGRLAAVEVFVSATNSSFEAKGKPQLEILFTVSHRGGESLLFLSKGIVDGVGVSLTREVLQVPQDAPVVSVLSSAAANKSNPIVLQIRTIGGPPVYLHDIRLYVAPAVNVVMTDNRTTPLLLVLRARPTPSLSSSLARRAVNTSLVVANTTVSADENVSRLCRFPEGYGLLSSEATRRTLRPALQFRNRFPTPPVTAARVRAKRPFAPVALSKRYDCVMYTAFYGGYEARLKRVVPQTHECHRIAFSDASLASLNGTEKLGNWTLITTSLSAMADRRFLYNNTEFRARTSKLLEAKFYKMKPFLLFPPHIRYAIWIDGTKEVLSSNFSATVIRAMNETGAPFVARTHWLDIHSELHLSSQRFLLRYNTFHIILQQMLAHYSEGLCAYHYELPKVFDLLKSPHFIDEATLAGLLYDTFCAPAASGGESQQSAMKDAAVLAARRFLLRIQRTGCQPSPRTPTEFPFLNASVATSNVSNARYRRPLYTCSILGFDLRLEHPLATFLRLFLSQWYEDTLHHGKDQLPLMMLLWRTPGFYPVPVDVFDSKWTGMFAEYSHGM